MRQPLPDGLVVVSPHLDDAVLSLGASIAYATGTGRRVTVLTVFAGDPSSTKEAGKWDRRGGFATEGAAARARRDEDLAACAVVGAKPAWLPNSEAEYRSALDEGTVWGAILGELGDALAVLFPGFPLTNPDHAWVTGLLKGRASFRGRVGLYAEQPYRYWVAREQSLEFRGASTSTFGAIRWQHSGVSLRLLRTKRRAICEYRSQVPLLGLDRGRVTRLDQLLAREAFERGEAIAWLPT